MNKLFNLFLLVGICCFTFSSCTTELDNYKEWIVGKWVLTEASSEGKDVTERMTGIFFEFEGDGKFTSNFNETVEAKSGDYKITVSDLEFDGGKSIYAIKSFEEGKLGIQADFQGVDFDIKLEKE